MPANGLRVNHYGFVALHSMWIIFLQGKCVLVRVEIIQQVKVDEFFSTVPGKNFDLLYNLLRHIYPLEKLSTLSEVP